MRNSSHSWLLVLSVIIVEQFVWTTATVYFSKQKLTIGAWINEPKETLLSKWRPLFETYLTHEVGSLYNPPIEFQLMPVDYDESNKVDALVAQGALDFIYHSAGRITCLESESTWTTIATEVHLVNGKEQEAYGSVLYSLKSNKIENITNMKGKRIGVGFPLEPAFFQLGASYLGEAGLNLYTDFAQVVSYLNDYEGLFNGIMIGDIDVAAAQSGWLEAHHPDKLSILRLHDVTNRTYRGVPYPLATTTPLVPNYGLSCSTAIPLRLQQQISDALKRLNATHPAAAAAGVTRFTLPASYDGVRFLVEKLGIMRQTGGGMKTCMDPFAPFVDLVSCPAGFTLERHLALLDGCRAKGLECPENVAGCLCRPCHPDMHVRIFPWQFVLGLCCALFAVGLSFSIGWTAILQGIDVLRALAPTRRKGVSSGKKLGDGGKDQLPRWKLTPDGPGA